MKRIVKMIRGMDVADKSGIKNMLLKPVSMILTLIYTPMLLSYLGDEKYGIWAAILSIITWISYCDIGIGDGLRNVLTKELTTEKYEEAKKSVSTAYVVLTSVATILLITIIIITFNMNWNSVFNTDIEMRPTLMITFIFIILNFVLALSNTMLYALQMAEKVAVRNCLKQVGNIVGVFILSKFSNSNLVYMAILFGGTSTITYVYNTVNILSNRKYLRPSIKNFDRKKIRIIGSKGLGYFMIQLSCLLLYNVTDFIIIHYFGSKAVTGYNILNKVFGVAFSFISALMIPYWARTTQAIASGDVNWVRETLKKMYKLYCVVAVGYMLLAVLAKPLMTIWLGREVQLQPQLIIVMCIFYIFYTFIVVNTPFINGTGKIKFQFCLSLAMGIINVPLCIFLGVNLGLGVPGIKLGTTILMLIGAVAYPINLQYILKNLDNNNE